MQPQLPDYWLESALEHITALWLRATLADTLPQLVGEEISAETFAAGFTARLEGRGLSTPSQQKNYRSNLTQALKSIDPQHPAIGLVALSTETYRELNDLQRGRLGLAQTKFISSSAAEQLVVRATQLLDSPQWSEVGAGLAVLIGRRVSEILLSRFEPYSNWSIRFRDPAKKPAELAEDFAIEIPTLAPAGVVMAAITRLQRALKIDALKAEALTLKGAKQKINQRYSAPISEACNRHFSGLVECRNGRDDLYSHLFRAIYATIAAHWFCPPTVPEHNFKAEIQGHFTIGAADGAKLPTFSARANYDDYAIGTADGNRDGRLGIKLGGLLGLQVMDAFAPGRRQQPAPTGLDTLQPQPALDSSSPHNIMSKQQQPTAKRGSLRIDGSQHDRWMHLIHSICPTALSQVERTTALLLWAEAKIANPSQPQPEQSSHAIPELAKTLSWLTSRIETLEAETTMLKAERDQLAEQQQSPLVQRQVTELQAENQQLKTQLNQTQATLDTIRQSLGFSDGAAAPADSVAKPMAQPAASLPKSPALPSTATATIASTATATAKPRRDSHGSTAKVHQIVDALLSWNSAQDDSDSMLRISIPIVKAIGSAMGASYQQSIQLVLKEREEELERFHSQHLLGVRHNASVQGREQILQQVARNYLSLDNWQDVKA